MSAPSVPISRAPALRFSRADPWVPSAVGGGRVRYQWLPAWAAARRRWSCTDRRSDVRPKYARSRTPSSLFLSALSHTRAGVRRAGVLDEHFRDMDAKDTDDSGVGFDASSGVNHLELFKWKANVPPATVLAARRTIAGLATTVPSLGHTSLLSGEALAGRNNSADLAVVAHFASVEDLEAYERSAERLAAIESIRPLLAEAPATTSFGNDVPAVLAEESSGGAVPLGSGSVGEQVLQADYAAALQVLAEHDGKPTEQNPARSAATKAGSPKRAPPPPPSANPPSAEEADAILDAHFAKTTPSR